MGKIIGKILALLIMRGIMILLFAPLLQYFVNHLFTASQLIPVFGGFMTFWQAVYVGGIAAILSML